MSTRTERIAGARMPEPSARARFVEAMRRLDGTIHAAMNLKFQDEAYEDMRQAVEAFADAECNWDDPEPQIRSCLSGGHAACRAALLKEVMGE